jgi:signal transduction histidine kinase
MAPRLGMPIRQQRHDRSAMAGPGANHQKNLENDRRTGRPDIVKKRILVVEDEQVLRESLGPILEAEGYVVSFAENGREALKRLQSESLPRIIVLDLRMPIMNGWEFRAIQKDDPKLGVIPVVAMSADASAQATTISAQAYLRKPLDVSHFLRTIERILYDSERRQLSGMLEEAHRLASLGRLAAGVGHEINNPLTFALLNLRESLGRLQPVIINPESSLRGTPPEVELRELKERLANVTEMLEDCQIGMERIRHTVANLQQLCRQSDQRGGPLDVRELIHQAISMAWNQIRHCARLDKHLIEVPLIRGNAGTLGQVFLNLLVNAAQAIPEGDAERNHIRVSTQVVDGEIVVEIIDTGRGIAPELLSQVFEPFFTTRPVGVGTGLGLSISRQTVVDHGGRIEVDSQLGKGTTFRIFLPPAHSPAPTDMHSRFSTSEQPTPVPLRMRSLNIWEPDRPPQKV